jgi:hypothetical protein
MPSETGLLWVFVRLLVLRGMVNLPPQHCGYLTAVADKKEQSFGEVILFLPPETRKPAPGEPNTGL